MIGKSIVVAAALVIAAPLARAETAACFHDRQPGGCHERAIADKLAEAKAKAERQRLAIEAETERREAEKKRLGYRDERDFEPGDYRDVKIEAANGQTYRVVFLKQPWRTAAGRAATLYPMDGAGEYTGRIGLVFPCDSGHHYELWGDHLIGMSYAPPRSVVGEAERIVCR